ncbi:MAG: metallophosphoesterase [Chloroflexi bacterium]|nr:metallophosphoesterase [Chloroflexota bacterium]
MARPRAWLWLMPLLFMLADGPILMRGPYVQSVTTTSAIVIWRTAEASDSRVDYGVGSYANSIGDPTPTTEHVIMLTGLITGTVVTYRVFSDKVELATGSFHTAADPDQAFRFGVIGDTGIGSTAQQQVADRLVALAPDFVLHTGDVIYPTGQAAGYDPFFFQIYQTLLRRAPMFLTLGNHDYGTAGGQPYLDAFYLPHNNPANSERYYSFDWGSAHFTALDFNDGPSPAQLDWLQADLAATDQPWKFVVYHQAIYSSGPHGSEPYIISKRAVLAPIFEAHHVDIVFNGHDHDYERTQSINGVIYIVSGGGGASLYNITPQTFSAYAETAHHAVVVDVDGCALSLQAVKPDGTIFDTLTLNKVCAEPTPVPTQTPSPMPTITFMPSSLIFLPVFLKDW